MESGIKILIVDDEHSVCISLSEYLLDQGYQVRSVLTAEGAIKQIKKEKPDIMIVDIRLPGIDGTKLIVKAHEIHADIKYLIHTGSVAFSMPDYLIELGLTPDHILKKPVRNLDIFNEKINFVLKK
jgi:DNA-binding NtrC family response regulator